MVPLRYVFVRFQLCCCYFVKHGVCISTEGTLNVCHTLDVYRREILGCDKVTGYMRGVVCHCVSCCRNPSLFLSLPIANHLSIFLSVPVVPWALHACVLCVHEVNISTNRCLDQGCDVIKIKGSKQLAAGLWHACLLVLLPSGFLYSVSRGTEGPGTVNLFTCPDDA